MILKVENIGKTLGRHKILKDVHFEMNAATLYGIVGENGSGKSTLLKIIVGEWQADHGKISVAGRLGYCPQKTLLFAQLTVEEHFRYFASAYGIDHHAMTTQGETLMEVFNFRKYQNEKVANLSGGTQQKLNLSIALLHKPDLLILDEPYIGFDWDTYLRFWKYTGELRKEGCAILVVTHLLNDTQPFDKVYSLEQGHLV